MDKELEKLICDDLSNTVDGIAFMRKMHRDGKTINELTNKIVDLIAENDISVSEALGMMDYMKYLITSKGYLRSQKQQKS